MLVEVLKYLESKITSAVRPEVMQEDRKVNRIISYPDGTVKVLDREPADRRHQSDSLATIATFALRASAEADKQPSCWYSEAGVLFYLDDHERFDVIKMELKSSTQMIELAKLEANKPDLTQAALLSMLRSTFKGCPADTTLVNRLKSVKFTVAIEGNSDLGRGKTSISRSELAEFHGFEDLPDTIEMRVPRWQSKFVAPVTVRCYLEPDAASKTFKFFPFPGEVERASLEAVAQLGGMLREILPATMVDYLYQGTP